MQLKRVVVTGMGAITPLGNNVNAFWNGLVEGRSGADWITKFDASKFKTRFACEVKGFDADQYFDKKEARKMDIVCHYSIAAADEAIKQAGLDLEKINKERVGVIWGSGNGGITTFHQQVVEFALGDGTPKFNPFLVPKMIVDMASGLIAIRYGFMGVNFCPVSACATSTSAIVEAYDNIRLGKADIIVAGGAEAPIVESGVGGFSALKALSTRNDDFKAASRPYDTDRDGFVIGEGAGALILEDLEHAKARGATIYAEIIGGAMSADAYHMTAIHPDGYGAYLAMRNALTDAGIQPSEIDYINTHGTSTPVGDIGELKAIKRLIGDGPANASISSTKSMTGHLLGGAGAVEAIASIKAINEGIVPPNINTVNLDPEIPQGINIALQTIRKPIRIAMSNTFGFGGHNAIALFKKWEA
ncbi:MAG TPA: beta-ketoacyl-ACP synthase II [Cytophagaceae bacterium]|nr:beta-ketoacyl-ACP synthase II [Cytophagaceae bacterium]